MQRGVRYLRRVNVWYRPGMPHWDANHGGMAEWIDSLLPKWKEKNPEVEVVLHKVTDPEQVTGDLTYPRVEGEYINGATTQWSLHRAAAESIEMAVNDMRNTCNDCEPRPAQYKVIETDQESIQGMWTPYLWMRDRPAQQDVDWEGRWKEELKDVAKYVRRKKQHREKEFSRKYWLEQGIRERMQRRWDEEVFPYTVGPETRAIPGRLHIDETRTIFQDSGSTPPRGDQEPGGGVFMGGFVSPYRGGEEAAAGIGGTGGGDTNKFDARRHGGGAAYNVPPFAGAPFTTGYQDYENFWQNWDLFHYSSAAYPPDVASKAGPPASRNEAEKRRAEQFFRRERHFRKLDEQAKWDNMS